MRKIYYLITLCLFKTSCDYEDKILIFLRNGVQFERNISDIKHNSNTAAKDALNYIVFFSQTFYIWRNVIYLKVHSSRALQYCKRMCTYKRNKIRYYYSSAKLQSSAKKHRATIMTTYMAHHFLCSKGQNDKYRGSCFIVFI